MSPWLTGLVVGAVVGGLAVALLWRLRLARRPDPAAADGAALSDRAARLETILDAAPEAMIVAGDDGVIHHFNTQAERAFGYRQEDIVGKSMEILIPEVYRVEHRRHFESFSKDTEMIRNMLGRPDIAGLRKDGTTFPAAASVAKLAHGGETLFVAVMRDISEHRRMEYRQRQLTSAIDAISEAVSVYDADDRFVFGNKRFRELNTLVSDLLQPGVHIEDLLRAIADRGGVPDAVGRVEDWVAERMARHRNPAGPFEVQRQSGWVMVTEERMADGGTVLLSADITRYKEAEQQRRQALEEMHRASLAKSHFLANISHELRTPLNAIMGFSDILRNEQFGPMGHERYREYSSDIFDSSHHLLMLVNDLLDISTIEAGEQTLKREPVDTAGVIEECLHIVRNAASAKSITLDTDVRIDMGVLHADRRAIKQIILNLLSNAVKFTPDGGRVSLSATSGNGRCVIAVADTGIGIPANDIPRLTDPFVRIEADHYTAQEGTGLGLAIVDALVKLHDGDLTIDSTVGKGTTVTVSVPD